MKRTKKRNPLMRMVSSAQAAFATHRKKILAGALAVSLTAGAVLGGSLLLPRVSAAAGSAIAGINSRFGQPDATVDAASDALASAGIQPTQAPAATDTPAASNNDAVEAPAPELEKIVPTDRWDETGKCTEAEKVAQAQSKSAMTFELVSPEEMLAITNQLHAVTATSLSDEEKKEQTKEIVDGLELTIASAFEEQVEHNALYTSEALRDVAGTYVKAFLYGFERYDDAMSAVAQAEGVAEFNDSVSIPFQTNPEEDSDLFLWELANRIVRDPVYADMWAQTFDETYMYDFNDETDKWELVSVGKVVNPLIHSFAKENKAERKKYKKGEGEGPWYTLRLKKCGEEIVVDPDSFKVMCLFGMMAKTLEYLGTTTDTPAVYWALNRVGVPDAIRRAAMRTDGNPETKPWAKLGFVRKEESAVGAGLVEYEIWVNLRDGRTGIPGEPTAPNTAPPAPVRPENPYAPQGNPTVTPTPAPQGNPSVSPVPTTPPTNPPQATATPTPVPTTPPTNPPQATATPTPVPTTPPQVTVTPIPVVTEPLKDPSQIIPDDHPNREDSDGEDNPDEAEDEQGDLRDEGEHNNGYVDDDGDVVQPSDPWNEGSPSDPYVAPQVTPEAVVTVTVPQREQPTDSASDYVTENDGTHGDTIHYQQDADGYWDAAPGTYTQPEDCNGNGSTADEEASVIDDSAGSQYSQVTESDTSSGGWIDQPDEGAINDDGASDGAYDYDI